MGFNDAPAADVPTPPVPAPGAPHPPPLAYAPPLQHTRLHPLTLFFAAWNAVRGLIVPIVVVIFLRRDSRGLGWVPLAGAFAAIAVAWGMARYFTFSYWITGGELILRSGLLARTERHIPLSRVQDVRLTQGVLHRLLRVVDVQIETAGGEGAEAKLSVLSQAEAERLREAIFAQRAVLVGAPAAPTAAGEPPGDTAPASVAAARPPRHTVRRVSTRELVLAGLTSNQVASGLAVVGALVALLDDFIDLTGFGPEFARAGKAVEQWLTAAGSAAIVILLAGALAAIALVGLLISVVGSVILFHGFELSLAGEDLHRSFGLFTRHASSLPRRRIQVLRIEEGLLRRMLKLATLRASSAGSKQTAGENEKAMDVLLPVVPRDEVPSLLPVVFPDAAERVEPAADAVLANDNPHEHPEWRRVSPRAIRRETFKGTAVILLFTAAAVVFKGPGWLALLALIPAVYVLNVVAYRHLGYAKDVAFFRARRGWLSRLTQIVPVRNVQTLKLTQTPFDRRHGVVTVRVDTAGAGGGAPKIDNVPSDDAFALAVALAHQAAAQRYRW